MPKWIPEKLWLGRDVFIVGGGDSLRNFDWEILKKEFVIGCNTAYTLGKEICDICVFGDVKWFTGNSKGFKGHKLQLEKYKGAVFTNAPALQNTTIPWVWTMPRETKGLHTNALGWNANTGSIAVNLALLLGAKRIFLLGFDMHLSKKGNPNWHDKVIDKPRKDVYQRFINGFLRVAEDLKKKFPDVEVFNVTSDSDLEVFPKIDFDKFWMERKDR